MVGYVNLSTGKIVGVKKGTREYYHEVGHLVYNSHDNGIKNNAYQQFIFDMMFPFIIGSVWFPKLAICAAILFLIYQGFNLYEEKWCWDYADRRIKKDEHKLPTK